LRASGGGAFGPSLCSKRRPRIFRGGASSSTREISTQSPARVLARKVGFEPVASITFESSSGPVCFAMPESRWKRWSSGVSASADSAKFSAMNARMASGVPAANAFRNASMRRPCGVSGSGGEAARRTGARQRTTSRASRRGRLMTPLYAPAGPRLRRQKCEEAIY
jgi:hypothetical protein